jgi:cytochrome c2
MKPIYAVLPVLLAGQAWGADLILDRGDPAKGREMYVKLCVVCHGDEPGKHGHVAPTLSGVVGRKAGTAPDYDYSPAMVAYGQVWTAQTLSLYLEDPKHFVPGGWMKFPGIPDKYDRADMIAYLKEITSR